LAHAIARRAPSASLRDHERGQNSDFNDAKATVESP
jgi:hypothetical protein